MQSGNITAKQRVFLLYKLILRLHRFLPSDLRSLGDSYVREEFKKHRAAKTQHAQMFMTEWNNYASMLAQQVRKPRKEIGSVLDETKLDHFRHEQLEQLLELFNSVKYDNNQASFDDNK